MIDKKKILNENGYESFIGYCFPTPPADDEYDNTFVEKDEAEKVIAAGAKEYFWIGDHDCLYDLDQAWEYFLEDYYDKNGKDFLYEERES